MLVMGTEVDSIEEERIVKPSELEEKIIRQIEYYFGNYNLGRDKFLKAEIKNDDGWVPLETLIRFQRLKQITVDFKIISEALKKSPNQLMEVNDDCTKIRRKEPLPDNFDKDEVNKRTLYVKGFNRNTSLDEILDFFKEYKVENILMRKQKKGNGFFFKGSVFATFNTLEDCEKFFETKGIKFDKKDLIKEKKIDYVKRKDEFYDNLRAEKEKKTAAGEKQLKEDMIKNCLLRVSGLKKGTSWVTIKETLMKFGKIAYVDFEKDNADAIVRFGTGIVPDILKEAKEEDGEYKLEIDNTDTTISLIDGDEEEKYWRGIPSSKANSKARGNMNHNKGRFNKKNRNKQRWGRNRDDDDEDDQRPAKRSKVETSDENEVKETSDSAMENTPAKTSEDQSPHKQGKIESNEENKEKSIAASESTSSEAME